MITAEDRNNRTYHCIIINIIMGKSRKLRSNFFFGRPGWR